MKKLLVRGVQKEDSVSVYLFLAVEVLFILIEKNSLIKGPNIFLIIHFYTQLFFGWSSLPTKKVICPQHIQNVSAGLPDA